MICRKSILTQKKYFKSSSRGGGKYIGQIGKTHNHSSFQGVRVPY